MKKVVLLASLILLLISFSTISDAQEIQAPNRTNERIDEIASTLSEGSEKIEGKISKEIKIPEKLQKPAKIIFGIDETSPLNILVISLMLWIIFFSFFFNIIEFFSPLSKNVALVVAIALTAIISFIGTIKTIAVFLFNIGNKIEFLEKLGILGTLIAFVIILAAWFLLSKTIKRMKFEKEKENAIAKGAKVAANQEFTESMIKGLGGDGI